MLLKEEQITKVDEVVQPLQLIAFVLISGVLIFALVCLAVNGTDSLTSKVDLLTLVGVVIGAAAIGKSVFLPQWIAASGVNAAQEKLGKDPITLVESLARVYQTKKIFQMALLEGAAFANLIFFLLYHSIVALIVVAIALAGLILVFPRRHAAHDWIANHLEK